MHQEDAIMLKVYILNNSFKIHEAKFMKTELEGEIDKCRFIVVDFNTSL